MSTDDQSEGDKDNDEIEPEATDSGESELFLDEAEELSPELKAQFLMSVAAYEEAPWTTHFQMLEESGIELPAPDTIGDERLSAKLWEIIEGLARRRVFLSQTDHLSDRELYELLWSDVLREPAKDMPLGAGAAWHLDLLGSGSAEDTELYLRYYADEDYRRQWAKSWPRDVIPEHVDPPFDRDRNLPKAEDITQVNNDDAVM